MNTMRETLTTYFEGERGQGFFWLGVGLVMLGAGLWLLFGRSDYRATGWPLVVLAGIEIAVGVTGVFNEARVTEMLAQLARDEAALTRSEAARMAGWATVFTIMKCVETGLVVAGAALVVTVPARSTWYAVGVGLIVQGAAALTLESIASRRNADYRAAVERLAGAAPDATSRD